MEQWKDIKGYEGLYQVSSIGRIKSFHINKLGNIIKTHHHNCGYVKVELNNKTPKNHYIHRLVASAFIRNENDKKCVNHKNCDKKDNRVENLEWCTYKENNRHAIENGLTINKGELSNNSKLSNVQAADVRNEYSGGKTTYSKLAIKYKVSKTTIGDIVRLEKYI